MLLAVSDLRIDQYPGWKSWEVVKDWMNGSRLMPLLQCFIKWISLSLFLSLSKESKSTGRAWCHGSNWGLSFSRHSILNPKPQNTVFFWLNRKKQVLLNPKSKNMLFFVPDLLESWLILMSLEHDIALVQTIPIFDAKQYECLVRVVN